MQAMPCTLAQARALAADSVVAYVVAGLRVIITPTYQLFRDSFFSIVLPRALFDEARAQSEAARTDLQWHLRYMLARRPLHDETRRQIRRALGAWRNLEAIGRQHETLPSLVQELVAQVRRLRSVLDERHEDLSDPAGYPEIVRIADRLQHARERDTILWIDRLGGAEIPLREMLLACGFRHVQLGGYAPSGCEQLSADDVPILGFALGLFKALQLLEIGDFTPGSRNFTAFDLETTDTDTGMGDLVGIAAVRVRDGEIVDAFSSLVQPNDRLPVCATELHGIRDAEDESGLPLA